MIDTTLLVSVLWAALLTLGGHYGDSLDCVIFAVLLFCLLTITGFFALRRTRTLMDRTYQACGHPVLPAARIAAASAIELLLPRYKPNDTRPGLPVYYPWRGMASV